MNTVNCKIRYNSKYNYFNSHQNHINTTLWITYESYHMHLTSHKLLSVNFQGNTSTYINQHCTGRSLAPSSARPSAGSVLTTKLNIHHSKGLWPSIIIIHNTSVDSHNIIINTMLIQNTNSNAQPRISGQSSRQGTVSVSHSTNNDTLFRIQIPKWSYIIFNNYSIIYFQ